MSITSPSHLGFMLDVSRHYMPVENIKRLLKAAQLCGVNTMHWHLADDQGWRVEIKKYPLLTEVGSVRGNSCFGRVSETENNCGFYTQEQIKDIVAFARELGIQIIPEIELPGHASAMLAAYPRFGCSRTIIKDGEEQRVEEPYTYEVITAGGIFPNLICAGKDESLEFFKDILSEIVELFPAPYVHIGGDEALKLHWRRCPDCQRRIKEEGLKDEEDLQRWLVLQIGQFLADKGRSTIVYNDCLAGGMLPQHFIVHHWLGNDEETAQFMQAGGRVIRSDLEHYYFDYAYSSIDVEHIMHIPQVPDYAKGCEDKLLGVECMLWAERITNIDRAAYLLFPRLPAAMLMAKGGCQSPDAFLDELKAIQQRISELGLKGAPESDWQLTPEAKDADRQQDEHTRYSPESTLAEEEEIRLLQQEELEKLLRAIEMPAPMAMAVMDHAWKALPNYSGEYSSDMLPGADDMAAHLMGALDNRDEGDWSKLPEDIWLATMKAFTRFANEHHRSLGIYGFDRAFWTTRQMNARLFRIGELEYELKEEDGERCIDLHIPGDAVLTAQRLNRSVADARSFLARYYPDWTQLHMECTTWLLVPALRPMLREGANLLRFMNAFDIVEVDEDCDDVLEWVFYLTEEQQKTVSLEQLPEETSLQRNIKVHLLSGKKIGVARGILAREFRD